MKTRQLVLSDGFLHIPINDLEDTRYIAFRDAEGGRIGEFRAAVSVKEPYSYYALFLRGQEGKTVTVSCEDDSVGDALDAIRVGGAMEDRPELYPDLYREPDRQQVHFSSRRGWLNDPNGLVYADGEYHMCYQHNPLGNRHGGVNISWGLAVSRDGVHFREYPDAIVPRDSQTHIASGSAVVDTENLSGMGKGTILAAYTAHASRSFDGRPGAWFKGQILCFSTDGGYSFRPFPKNPIIDIPQGRSWRDPKILITDDGRLCLAVYETYDDKNCVSFYSSADCEHWKFESRTMELYECPDLFRLPVAETGETLWVLYGGNGMYRVGKFENYRFTQIGESMCLDYGSATYAGQTWNSHPDPEGRYHIAWMNENVWSQEKTSSVPFSQSMSLVCRFTLHETAAGYRLFRAPIDAVRSLREGSGEPMKGPAQNGSDGEWALPVPGEAEFTWDGTDPVRIEVNGHGFTFEPDTRLLRFTSGKEYALTSAGPLSVRIVADVRSVEFFICGEISATFISLPPDKKLAVRGEASRVRGTLWSLRSIWEKNS